MIRLGWLTAAVLALTFPLCGMPQDPASSGDPAGLARRPDSPASDAMFRIAAGTRIPLVLRTSIDTKKVHDGDQVYLDVQVPVFVNGRQVIPRGSAVNGVIAHSKSATAKNKAQLFIRFDILILPNGVQRDFRSRVGSADSGRGQVDRQEGGIAGERDASADTRSVAIGAGTGAGVGGLAGSAAGHPLGGVGIGAAAGAAAGLATVLHTHKADVVLPRGTTIEMILDRELVYSAAELGR